MNQDVKTISIPLEVIKEVSNTIKQGVSSSKIKKEEVPKKVSKPKTKKNKKNGLSMREFHQMQKITFSDDNGDNSDNRETEIANREAGLTEATRLKNLLTSIAYKKSSKNLASANDDTNKKSSYYTIQSNQLLSGESGGNQYGVLEQTPAYEITPAYSSTIPKWGCLKGGSLPTFRTYRRLNKHSHTDDQPNDKIIGETSFDIKELLNTTPEPIVNGNGKLGILSAPNISSDPLINIPLTVVNKKKTIEEKYEEIKKQKEANRIKEKEERVRRPMVKKTIKRTYPSGYSASSEKINVIINPETLGGIKKTIKINPYNGSNIESLNKMRCVLIKKGILQSDTSATPQMIKTMYNSLNEKDEVIVNSL